MEPGNIYIFIYLYIKFFLFHSQNSHTPFVISASFFFFPFLFLGFGFSCFRFLRDCKRGGGGAHHLSSIMVIDRHPWKCKEEHSV